ncbi:MAG: hypothetical protein R6X02_24055 [Enhygromyxa sp.]
MAARALASSPSPVLLGLALLGLALLPACGDTARDRAREVGEQAADKSKELAGELGDKAKGKAGELGDAAKDKAGEFGDKLGGAAKDKAGELSDSAKDIFARGAASSEGGVEALLAKGQQLAPVAFDIAKTLGGAFDSDVKIEPIVQKLDDPDAQAELDAKIKDMPRVETIDGVDVGFKDVTAWDSGGRETESAYLILWRRDNRLLGLVYRSRKRVKVDTLVAEAPRLLGLVSGAL